MNQFEINKQLVLKKKFLFLLILLISFASSFSQNKRQNIVPNSGFENYKSRAPLLKSAVPWMNEGTVDFYPRPDRKDTSRFKGPHTGKCYAGMRFQPNYKEYMYVKLTEPLVKNNVYSFEMYVRLQERSTVTVKQLGVYFSDDAFKIGMNFNQDGMIDSTYKEGISSEQGWVPIRGEYLAFGGEKYIIIGNFKTKMKDDFVRQKKWDIFEMREAYYYIDDVTLLKPLNLVNPESFVVKELPDIFEKGDVFELKNVGFEEGTTKLKRESQWALEDLIDKLNHYPFMEIKIKVHSDNTLKPSIALKLTQEQAGSLYNYLRDKSVINEITIEGMGGEYPIVPNDSDESRARNRRVEVEITRIQD